MRTSTLLSAAVGAVLLLAPPPALAQDVKNDPLVRMPGSQPVPEGHVSLEAPTRCLNCHGGYNPSIEPGHNWSGSMMAQAARDPVFWACMTVAAQDAKHVVGNTNATDLCLRCHFPQGWLEGRSDPTNATGMSGSDYDGVHCDFCHSAWDPFYEPTFYGTREGADWLGYWDEASSLSATAAQGTRDADAHEAGDIFLFTGGAKNAPFYQSDLPPIGYAENASGQYFVSTTRDKRASFADAAAKHGMLYSRYHKSKYLCSTCHDVSNPVLANLGADPSRPLPTETDSAHSYFHVERTFSEFMLSGYGQQGGAPGAGPFDPAVFQTSMANNWIARCQDCHMRDGVGAGCDKSGAPVRPSGSAEHAESGQPIHDLTGGNTWIPYVLASTVPGSPNYDPVNDLLLNQGAAVLTLDLSQGQPLDPVALLDAAGRAREQLGLAASIRNVGYDAASGTLTFRVHNQTGHKLISGFPEGRRMFVNIRVYQAGNLIWEVNPFDRAAGTLKGLAYTYQPDPEGNLPPPLPLGANEVHVDELVYETHPSSSQITSEDETFHFVLATDRYKDNRIPPKGFRIAEALSRLCQPRWHGQDAPDYFTSAEYAGGYDEVAITVPAGADSVEIDLYYQSTSREYMEFLRDEINGNPANITLDPSAYVAQSDPFFAQLAAWGDTIWSLWSHNYRQGVEGATPVLMTTTAPSGCGAPVPTLLDAAPSSNQVALTWSDEHRSDPDVIGYSLYYDQSGKSQWIADVGLVTAYTDTNLTNDNTYCYKVRSRYAACGSEFGNVRCATPRAPGQNVLAGVTAIVTGHETTTGQGKNRVTTFVQSDTFSAGDRIVINASVLDAGSGQPLAGAVVDLVIQPGSMLLSSAPSDANGVAVATWNTQAPNKRGQGGTPAGGYTITTANVSKIGYVWDGAPTSAAITIQ